MYYEQWKKILDNVNDYINSDQDISHQNIIDKIKERLVETHLETYLKWKSTDFDLSYLFSFRGEYMDNQYTLLYIVVYYGFANIVRALLAEGAEVDAVDSIHGAIPLHFAAKNGYTEVVKILLENGAEVDAVDNVHGATPLHFAAQNDHVEVVETLLRSGAEVNTRDSQYGATSLHLAAGNGYVDVVSTLLEKGASVNSVDKKYGAIPLHLAAGNGYVDVVEMLLDRGAIVRATDKDAATPLHWAAKNGHTAVVSALLEEDAEVDALDKDKATPLHVAARNDHMEVVNVLLANGANAFLKTKGGQTPRDLTSSYSIKQLLNRSGKREYTTLVAIGCVAVFCMVMFASTIWRDKLTFIERLRATLIVLVATALTALVVGVKCKKPRPSTQVDEMHTMEMHDNLCDSEISMV